MRRSNRVALLATLLALSVSGGAKAATCTADDFAAAVDRSGAALRSFNAKALPRLRDKLRQLKVKRGWVDGGFEEKALDSLSDKKIADYDAAARNLIFKFDTLGAPSADETPDCSKLAELNAAGLELLAVMKAKSAYTLSKLDAEIAKDANASAPDKKQPVKNAPSERAAAPDVAVAISPKPQAKTSPPRPAPKTSTPQWSTQTRPQRDTEVDTAFAPPPLPTDAIGEPQSAYTIDEIHEITRGFFGTISTSLASVIEYAFSKSGRPTAYVLGKEGGGAFLAGVRYGSGMLYLRAGGTQKIYWHGPSLGTDFGAAGSRTMFLIYDLHQPSALYRQFTGVDGSAYFVGGIGITFLKGGDIIMAPIRSGLGFRLGANVGYIRFTPRPTWNPF